MYIGKAASLQRRQKMPHVQRSAGRGGKSGNNSGHEHAAVVEVRGNQNVAL